jgi:branched-subunit amino acid ABC-type transport system permease component
VNGFVAAFLAQDGLANGAIYGLLAVAIVLVFGVTRIIFIPQGEYISYGALGYGALREGRIPGLIPLLLVLLATATVIDLARGAGTRVLRPMVAPVVIAGLAVSSVWVRPPPLIDAALTVGTVAAMGPLLYRIVYRRLSGATSLVLLVVAVANHFVMLGLGLYFFGPEGARTAPLVSAAFNFGGIPIQGQSLLIVACCSLLICALFALANYSPYGRALRAAAINPIGARLVGISAQMAGELTFLIAAFIGATSGVLISSTTTLYYDSGFLLGLKGFVAAALGGLLSFPLAGLGAVGLGLCESFASFYTSGFKETLVFSLMIPILLWRSFAEQRG